MVSDPISQALGLPALPLPQGPGLGSSRRPPLVLSETGICEGVVSTVPSPYEAVWELPPALSSRVGVVGSGLWVVHWLVRGFFGVQIRRWRLTPFLRPSICRLLSQALFLSTCSCSLLCLSFLLRKGLGQKVLVSVEPRFEESKAKKRLSGPSQSHATPERESAVRIAFNKAEQLVSPWFNSVFKFAVISDYCQM